MRSISRLSAVVCSAVLLACGCTGDASRRTIDPSPPDAMALIEEAAEKIQRLAYYADRVDWKVAVAQAQQGVSDPRSLDEAHAAIKGMLRQLRDNHSFLLRPDRANVLRENTAVDDIAIVSSDLGDIVVLEVPGFAGIQAVRERAYATRLHSVFERSGSVPACGWVVDLRQNTGGNMFPMLAGLAPLIGTTDVGKFVWRSGNAETWPTRSIFERIGVNISRFETPNLRSASVAVITGPRTMSSGEAVAIAFRGRPNTRSFGAPTSGRSTANQGQRLSDDSMLLITTALMADRNGVLYGVPIQPDEQVDTGTGVKPEDDRALAAAVGWLRGACNNRH